MLERIIPIDCPSDEHISRTYHAEKAKLKELAEKYNMDFVVDDITRQKTGLWLQSGEEIPELEAICDNTPYRYINGVCTRHNYDGGKLLTYYIGYPNDWCDLYGWR